MGWRFVRRVERAFRSGTETREAAGASYQCEKSSKKIVTAALLLVIGGKILSGRTKGPKRRLYRGI